jgi:hypothetical protein
MEFSASSPATADEIGALVDYSVPQLGPFFSGQHQPPTDVINSSYVAKAVRSAISNPQYANAFIRFICEKESILEQSDLSFYAEAFHNKHHCSHSDILKIESSLKDQIAAPAFVFARWKALLYNHQPHVLSTAAVAHSSSVSPPQLKKASASAVATDAFRKNVQDRLWKWCNKVDATSVFGRIVEEIKQYFYNADATFKTAVIIRQSEQNNNKFQFHCPCCAARLELDSAKPQMQTIYRHVSDVHLKIPRKDLLRQLTGESDATSSSEASGRKRNKPYPTTGLRHKQTRLSSDTSSAAAAAAASAPASASVASAENTVVPQPGPLTEIPTADDAAAEVSGGLPWYYIFLFCN